MAASDDQLVTIEPDLRKIYVQQLHLESLQRRWKWFLVLGVLMTLLGAVATVYSVVTTLTTLVLIGCLMMAGGVLEAASLVSSVKNREGLLLSLLTGLLYIVCGWMLATNPAAGALAFTLIAAMFLFFGGVYRMLIALVERYPGWGWVLIHGMLNVLMGVFIWRQWPLSGLWVVGLFVGLDMIFHGCGFILLGLLARKLTGRSLSASSD